MGWGWLSAGEQERCWQALQGHPWSSPRLVVQSHPLSLCRYLRCLTSLHCCLSQETNPLKQLFLDCLHFRRPTNLWRCPTNLWRCPTQGAEGISSWVDQNHEMLDDQPTSPQHLWLSAAEGWATASPQKPWSIPWGHMYALVTALRMSLGGCGSPPELCRAAMGERKARGRAEDKLFFFFPLISKFLLTLIKRKKPPPCPLCAHRSRCCKRSKAES